MLRTACRVAKAGLLAAVAFALNAPAIGQGARAKLYDLHVATPKGTTVWFVESATTEQTQTMAGKDMTSGFQVNSTFGITVKQVDAKGNRVIEIHVARVTGWMQVRLGQAKKTLFDSNSPNGNGGASGLGMWTNRMMAAAGRRYIARIDVNGKLVGSMAGIAHEMRGADPQTNVQVWELANLAETAFGHTPAEPTAIRSTWNFVRQEMRAMVTHHATLTLVKVTDGAFEMALSGTIEKNKSLTTSKSTAPNSPEAKAAEQLKAIKVRNGKLTGKQILSRQDGLVIESKSESTFDLDTPRDTQVRTLRMVTKTSLTRTTKPEIKPRKQKVAAATLAARIARSQTDLKLLAGAVRMYYTRNSKLPESLAVLAEKDQRGRSELEELSKDSWGQPYELVKGDTPREFHVISAGPDKKLGTEDDISSRSSRR